MTERAEEYESLSSIKINDRVKVPSRPDLGMGEVLRVADVAGIYQADVVFDAAGRQKA